MNYYVLGPNGEKYGPADIATLNSWALEKRVLPTTQLEDMNSGMRLAASAVQGINFPVTPPPAAAQSYGPPPSTPGTTGGYAPYQRPGYGGPSPLFSFNPQPYILGAIACIIGAPLVGYLIGILSIFIGITGIRVSSVLVTAKHPTGIPLLILNVVALIVGIVLRYTYGFGHLGMRTY